MFKQKPNESDNFFLHFNEIDTSCTEPQKYSFAFILQNTNVYEVYRLSSSDKQSIVFTPEATVRIRFYFGWRRISLGHILDIKHLDFWNKNNNPRQEYGLSLYNSMPGLDIYYRKTGNGYKIRQLYLEKDTSTDAIRGTDFGGLALATKGFNLYYTFNHRRFSYPIAFSQSMMRCRSTGSPLLSVGYTQHSLDVNWGKLNKAISSRLDSQVSANPIGSTLMLSEIRYANIFISSGYAYSWIFARNWVLAGSLSLALAYESSKGDVTQHTFSVNDSKFSNINVDGVRRFGVVWNNSKWYVGMSAILYVYNYRRSNFSTSNFFESINLYAGFNFERKKEK